MKFWCANDDNDTGNHIVRNKTEEFPGENLDTFIYCIHENPSATIESSACAAASIVQPTCIITKKLIDIHEVAYRPNNDSLTY